MAGFRKAKAEQAKLKMSMYGPPGSGKTATALLIAEGLALSEGKRIAFVDTERGTDFYTLDNAEREWHPRGFDFDALYTRSLTEVLADVRALDDETHGVLVIDSMTHLWDAAIAAYTGPKTRDGGIPLPAWGKIKQPYKDLLAHLINCQQHVIILGRQSSEMEDDEGTMRLVGVKMRAEKETAHEPHVCIRMECVFDRSGKSKKKVGLGVPTAFVEKDRTGMLQGRAIEWPNFESIARPIMALLGGTQAQIQSEEEAAHADAEAIGKADREKVATSRIHKEQFESRLTLAQDLALVEGIGREIKAAKKDMLQRDVEALKTAFVTARDRVTNGMAAAAGQVPTTEA